MLVKGETYKIKSYKGPEPDIDGAININERDGTGKPEKIILQFDPWNHGGDQLPREVEVGSFHTSNSSIYINTKIEFEDIIDANITYFLRKKGTDDPFDAKRIMSITNSSLDGYRTPNNYYINDTEQGGEQNIIGKCYLTESYITFELYFQFNSNDTFGYDINIQQSDEIELEISLHFSYPGEYMTSVNSYLWSETDSCTILFRDRSAVPIPYIPLVVGLIITTGISILNHTRKKRISN